MRLTILYRGPLSSCNYGCPYCPFALRRSDRAELDADRAALARFASWVASREGDSLSLFFTPWGEALVRPWCREAIATLSRLPQVRKVAAQTNLSCPLAWVEGCDKGRLALWCSYHPTEVSRRRFLASCQELDRRGVRFSVGAVGVKEHEEEIRALRAELPAHVYLWVNALKERPGYYSEEDLARFEGIDPLFRLNAADHRSGGRLCHAGHTAISVDGDGTMRRCHFVRTPIGNLYEPGFEEALRPHACPRALCRCHIGYVHLKPLGLETVFGEGLLERIPHGWAETSRADAALRQK